MVKVIQNAYGWEITTFTNKAGLLHNARGPAKKTKYNKRDWDHSWYRNGLRHRVGAPAELSSDGREWWYENGKLHRTDGPAVVLGRDYVCGPQYWIRGTFYTKAQFDMHTLHLSCRALTISP